MAGAAGRSRARLRPHLAPPTGQLERHRVAAQVHTALVRMVRAGPEVASWEVVVDSCSVRAKHGGELTGPNPTDRSKIGTKYHVVVATDGLPLAAVPSAANVHDTRLFPHLLGLAQVVCAAIGRLYARRRLRQRRQPRALRSRGYPASHPQGGPAARLGARLRPLHRRARLCVAVGQQAAGPPPGQAGSCDPGPPDCHLVPVAQRTDQQTKRQ